MSNDARDAKDPAARPLPTRLGRFRAVRPLEPGSARLLGTHELTDEVAELVRVEAASEAARDAFVARARAWTAVVEPGLRAVIDAGEWDEGAFVALAARRGETPLSVWCEGARTAETRARVAAGLLAVARRLAHERLALPDDGPLEIVVDDYGAPLVSGLERATRVEAPALDPRLREAAAAALDDAALAAALRAADEAEAFALERSLAQRGGAPMPASFTADVARGQAAMSRSARGRELTIALVVLAGFALVAAAIVFAR